MGQTTFLRTDLLASETTPARDGAFHRRHAGCHRHQGHCADSARCTLAVWSLADTSQRTEVPTTRAYEDCGLSSVDVASCLCMFVAFFTSRNLSMQCLGATANFTSSLYLGCMMATIGRNDK